jgi:hypothetical protein
MSISDSPVNLGAASFMRNFLPGFTFSVLLSYTFIPGITPTSELLGSLEFAQKLILWAFVGLVLGLLISSKDFYVYQVLNGYKCGLPWVFAWRYSKELEKYEKDRNELNELNKGGKGSCSEHRILSLSSKIRKNPFDKNINPKFFKPVTWTRLGNTIEEYQTYSEVCYGMRFNVFFYRLWYVLSKDEQDDIEQRGAKSDFLSYMSFLFLLYSLVSGFGWFSQIGDMSIAGLSGYELGGVIWILSFILSILIHRIFYECSISAHENYGGYIKALFDIHHKDLIAILTPSDQKEIEKCLDYSGRFEDYTQFNE